MEEKNTNGEKRQGLQSDKSRKNKPETPSGKENSTSAGNKIRKKHPVGEKGKTVKKVLKKPVNKQQRKFSYKNTLLMCISVLLFAYIIIISFVAPTVTKNFNITEFEEKAFESSGIMVKLSKFNYNIKPNLHGEIKLTGFEAKWPGDQPLFFARNIVIETNNPFCVFTKKFDINSMELKNVVYADQILPNGNNKLLSFPPNFNPETFGAKMVYIKPGTVHVKDFKITYTTPDSYDETTMSERLYQKQDVKTFLSQYNFRNIRIK